MPRTHKTLPRLYVEDDLVPGVTISLGRDHANYLVNVLRRAPGDHCVVFNGRDGAWLSEISKAGKKDVMLTLIEQSAPQTAPGDLWYGFAPIKRLDYVVQKATEMGAGTIQPVVTRHVQNPRVNIDKLRANAIEAAEQCEVLSVPAIGEATTLEKLIDRWPEEHGERALVLCDEEAAPGSPIDALAALEGRPIGVLIGPEGGFSPDEREKLLALPFVRPISLGPRILRADTAAVAALALIQAVAGDW